MKKLLNLGFLLMLSLALMSTTCSSDDDGNNTVNNAAEIQNIIDTAESGTWRITYFFDTDQEETSHYSDYNFTFSSDGALSATNGTNTYSGTWSVTDDSNSSDDNSSDDNSSDDDIDFNIAFVSPANFEELSDDWDIVSVNATTITLIDVSGGNGGTDYLTFEKN